MIWVCVYCGSEDESDTQPTCDYCKVKMEPKWDRE